MAIFSDRGSTPLISTRINPILEVDWWNTRAEDSVLEALSSVFIFGDNYYMYATKKILLCYGIISVPFHYKNGFTLILNLCYNAVKKN